MKEYLLVINELYKSGYFSDEDVIKCVEHAAKEITDYPECNSLKEIHSAKEEDFLVNYYLEHLQDKFAVFSLFRQVYYRVIK